MLAAARRLFRDRGYAHTSLEDIAAVAGVTKGALYHHFSSKRAVFRAACEAEQDELTRLQSAAFRSKRDPWDGLRAGCEAYLRAAMDPGIQQLMLLDAPGVLGWEAIREIEQEAFAMTVAGVERAMDAGRVARRAPEPLVHLLFGALGEAAASTGRAEDPQAALHETLRELRRLLDGLALA